MGVAGRTRQEAECGTKAVWPSWQVALNAAILHGWAGRTGMAPYRCRFGEHYHVGHPSPDEWGQSLLRIVAREEARVVGAG